ncbi:MAG: hypothetical protein JSS57_02830 [Proteobacteria bacterium]|nr:hypothetical protein [Pseudomonadota bacterium]
MNSAALLGVRWNEWLCLSIVDAFIDLGILTRKDVQAEISGYYEPFATANFKALPQILLGTPTTRRNEQNMMTVNKTWGYPVLRQVRFIEKAEALDGLKSYAKATEPITLEWLASNRY